MFLKEALFHKNVMRKRVEVFLCMQYIYCYLIKMADAFPSAHALRTALITSLCIDRCSTNADRAIPLASLRKMKAFNP